MTREEAIWWVNHLFEIRKEEYFNKRMMKDAIEVEEAQTMAIEALSAEAVQGEWTNEDGKPITDKFCVYCSRCKEWSEYRTDYCGHCGAKMTKGGGDEWANTNY